MWPNPCGSEFPSWYLKLSSFSVEHNQSRYGSMKSRVDGHQCHNSMLIPEGLLGP